MAGDREMPAWRLMLVLLPSTILAYIVVAPTDISWRMKTPVGLLITALLMATAIWFSAHKWPLTSKSEHFPQQYDPDVPENAPPPQHTSL
jgi:hypothetical protein